MHAGFHKGFAFILFTTNTEGCSEVLSMEICRLRICDHLLDWNTHSCEKIEPAEETFTMTWNDAITSIYQGYLGVTKECLLEALKSLKTSKQHPFETPGTYDILHIPGLCLKMGSHLQWHLWVTPLAFPFPLTPNPLGHSHHSAQGQGFHFNPLGGLTAGNGKQKRTEQKSLCQSHQTLATKQHSTFPTLPKKNLQNNHKT